MKQLNWYQIFGQTHTIPDGSTVTPTDDVQILLNCANIWDKAYTTIADLLSDTTSLLAVIVDNNAINYLVRSTTFASSVTADATAMTDIGGDNYASNTLLGDSTWCTAICNSTYFESVLNVKVPAMTSNTTPEGVCSATSVYTYGGDSFPAYLAFDGNESTRWIGISFPNTVYYEFTEVVKIFAFTYKGDSVNNTAKDMALVDGSNTVLESFTADNVAEVQKFVLSSPASLTKFGLKIINPYGGASNAAAKVLQFYGRADV